MHQPTLFSGGGGTIALCLLWLATGGCSGSKTDDLNRDLGSAKKDASEEAIAEPALEDPSLEEDAAIFVSEEDASLPAEMDAATPEDSAASELDAGSASDAGTAPDANDSAVSALDAGQDATLQPGATVPKNYLRPADSPFSAVDFAYFQLEDFEDHLLNTPGLRSVTGPLSTTSVGVLSSSFSAEVIDSVDGDDGIPNDNRCMKADGICDAWWGAGTLTFSFDTEVLGALPTHAGGVWTDGLGEVSFEAFGPDGTSIYKVGPLSEPGFPDNTTSSSTGEDRFFGVYAPGGISAFTISNTSGGVEVDHVQYGRAR